MNFVGLETNYWKRKQNINNTYIRLKHKHKHINQKQNRGITSILKMAEELQMKDLQMKGLTEKCTAMLAGLEKSKRKELVNKIQTIQTIKHA
jgi:hypothetical protein